MTDPGGLCGWGDVQPLLRLCSLIELFRLYRFPRFMVSKVLISSYTHLQERVRVSVKKLQEHSSVPITALIAKPRRMLESGQSTSASTSDIYTVIIIFYDFIGLTNCIIFRVLRVPKRLRRLIPTHCEVHVKAWDIPLRIYTCIGP